MRNDTRARADRSSNAPLQQMLGQRSHLSRRDIEVENIGLRQLDLQTEVAQCTGKKRGVRMILREAFDIVLERVQARCGENPYLPHASSQCFAPASRGADELMGTQ